MGTKLKLIAGLGNPGKEYSATRHNVGAWWLQTLCSQHKTKLQTVSKFHGMFAKITIDTTPIYCFIPTTYMNLSGTAIASILSYYDIRTTEMLIVHDDLDLLPGTIRIKDTGGHGGHNGLRNIIEVLASNNFYRLRIGIGHPGHKDLVSDYVLQKPNKNEATAIERAIAASLVEVPHLVIGEFSTAMNQLHNFSG